MFLASPWRYIDFQTSHFADFEQFKVDIYFTNFEQAKIDPIWSFYSLWTGHIYFTKFGQDMLRKKRFKPSLFDKNSRTMHIKSSTGHFQ